MLAVVPVDTFGYKLMLLLHILAVIVAFAPGFVWPVVSVRLKKRGEAPGPVIGAMAAGNTATVHGPALVLVGLFGFGLVGMSKPDFPGAEAIWEFSQTWVSMAMVIWFAMIGILSGLLLPAEKAAGAGDADADKKISMFGGFLHILLLLMLIDMIWKPFL